LSELAREPGTGPLRVLLLGDPSVRPYGLERALGRAGFHLSEAAAPAAPARAEPAGPPDVALIAAEEADAGLATLLQALHAAWGGRVPLVVVLASPDREGPTRALGMGADDAMASPVHLPELCARLEARARPRARPARGCPETNGRLQEMMLDLLEAAQGRRRPDEVLDVLVERLGRLLPRWEVELLASEEPERGVRVVATTRRPASREVRLDLERYPEIAEALRTARPVAVADLQTDPLLEAMRRRWAYERTEVPVRAVTALPLTAGERVVGALVLRTGEPGARLSAVEERVVGQAADAAARVLAAERRAPAPSPGEAPAVDPLTGLPTVEALDRRIVEESERAKRYALSFTLVLLDVEDQAALNRRLGPEAGDRLLAELGRTLQREVRASDFVARYGGDEFALVLAETGPAGGRDLVRRLRQRIGVESFAGLPAGERAQLAAGIVAFPHPAVEQTSDLLVLLEAALRRGKAQSEERIGVAE